MANNDKPVGISLRTYGHTADIKNGNIPVDGAKLDFIEVVPQVAAFRRMIRDVEFEICELAPTTYFIAKAIGHAPYKALPVFFERRFHHGGFVVREDSGINTVRDLEGKRAGVRSYSGTTGVWTRGVYINEFGLDNDRVTWVVDDEEHVTQLKLPPNVEHAPPKSLPQLMASGSIQGGFLSRADKAANDGHAGLGRAGLSAETAQYRELVDNPFERGVEWYNRTGIYPMHSLLVIRDDVLADRPGLAHALYDALKEGKRRYLGSLDNGTADAAIDNRYRKQQKAVGDPLPYGLRANMPTLEALMTYAVQQKLIPRALPVKDLFLDID
ncbi:PhnD/SsuA/transferrin family substrate-binding protein [Phyllobacterium lublinensis]|uniref:PhnD/SsuA/transferrin family substrate-binding protein n=1 Tax=Phyllobacterium lublinensis TaxID=2875708 RepID=UPI001CCD4D62|nr:PhnD/SsuA/transferrin family substrate-binding protein [Phyllobacterium sp. 2063]MBZ9653735.1 ABC transporter substrate-binding protein [Phyllobacterium sp. 2063]